MKSHALKYFAAFSARDAAAVRSLLSPDAVLRDWDVDAVGIDAVMAVSASIFAAAPALKVTPLNVYGDGQTVVGELAIDVGEALPLKVVDVIEFDSDGLIRAIRAYKG